VQRLLIILAGLMLLCFTQAWAAEKQPASVPLSPRVTEMNTAGKVLEISGTVLKIERTLKGKAETLELILEKPLSDIVAGDQLRVSYVEKEGRKVLTRVAPAKKTAVQKPKKDSPKVSKPVEPQVTPVVK